MSQSHKSVPGAQSGVTKNSSTTYIHTYILYTYMYIHTIYICRYILHICTYTYSRDNVLLEIVYNSEFLSQGHWALKSHSHECARSTAYVFTQDNDLSTLQTFTRNFIQVLHVLATDSTSLADPNLLTYHGGMLIPMAQPTTPAKATSHHLS